MTQPQILRWPPGSGWLIFSGGDDGHGAIRSEALSRALRDGHAVYISFAEDGGDALIDDMEDLGAPAGYLLDIHEGDAAIHNQLQEASIVVLEAGEHVDPLLRSMNESLKLALLSSYERGAVLLVEGLAINLFGRWVLSDAGDLFEGWNWIENAFLEPEAHGIQSSTAVQRVLSLIPEAIAISIGAGSALALGPQGRIDLLGERQVMLSLGLAYQEKLNYRDEEQT